MSNRGRHVRLILLLLLACGLVAARSESASLLANGSFETGPAVPGDAVLLSAGSTAINNWVVTRANLDYCGPTRWSAAQGNFSIGLNGTNAGGIAQTFTTINRATYNVRLYLCGDPASSPAVKSMRVAAAGQSVDFTFDTTDFWEWDPGWDLRTWSFTANSNSTTIELYSLMTGATGPAIDSVSVELGSLAGVQGLQAPAFALSAVVPNPTVDQGRVEFSVPETTPIRLSVLDLQGREVSVLADGTFGPGNHSATWNGQTANGRAGAGIYFVQLNAPGRRLSQRLVVLR